MFFEQTGFNNRVKNMMFSAVSVARDPGFRASQGWSAAITGREGMARMAALRW